MTNKNYILLLFLSTITLTINAQRSYETNPDRKRTYNWLFGDKIWLDYKANPPIDKNGSQLLELESAAVFSDTAGNLILYSDGSTVWNKNHNIVKNGDSLYGHPSSSQGSLFIPQPENDNIVYLFTTDYQGEQKGFCYNKIKLDKNADSITVVEKNIRLLPSVCESISATKHANGKWTWVVVHSSSGYILNAFLVTDKGLVTCGVSSNGNYLFDGDRINCQSASAFSNNSSIYCITVIADFHVEFLNFDNLSGKFKPLQELSFIWIPASVTFTNNNKYCYVTEREKRVLRINCNDWSIETLFDIKDSFYVVDTYMNPYNQIMLNIFDSTFLGRIDNPADNNKFIKKGLVLSRKTTSGLINFDNSYYNTIGANFEYKIKCYSNQVDFNGQDTFSANNHLWKVKKVSGGSWQNIGTLKNITYSFPDTGIYITQYIASKGSITDTITKQIIIGNKISKDFLGRDTGYCKGAFPALTLQAPTGMHCIKWNNDSTTQSINLNKVGQYIVTITTAGFCQTTDTINLYEDTLIPKPQIIRHGDSLLSNVKATQYIWKRNNIIISHSPAIKINQTGVYQLQIFGNGGCPVLSDTINIVKLSISSLSIQNITIYPNPVADNIVIEGLNPNNTYNLSVIDNIGINLLSLIVQHTANFNIPLTNLANGIYIIQIKDNNYNLTIRKIIKQ